MAPYFPNNIIENALGTDNIEEEFGFSIYPNPTNGIVSVQGKILGRYLFMI